MRLKHLVVLCLCAAFGRTAPQLTVNDVIATVLLSPEMQAAEGRGTEAQRLAFVKAVYNNITILRESLKDYREPPKESYKFPCTAGAPATPATSVHQLTPGDINVVAALGDSISAGTAIASKTIIGLIDSYRGLVFSIGGDATFETNPTLPNILRKYNPHLKGFALGIGSVNSEQAHLDVAHAGDKSEDMPYQAQHLVDKIRADKTIDQQNDWKMVTLFIGGNDLCAFCKDPPKRTAEEYTSRIENAIDILYNNLNRTFVNIVGVLDVSQIRQLNRGVVCAAAHVLECRCGAYSRTPEPMRHLEGQYQHQSCVMASGKKYQSRDDFAVVFQPFFTETKLPVAKDGRADLSYFAPDCFHLSRKGQAAMSISLWNNLLEPLPEKQFSWHDGEPWDCPTAKKPYFATWKNSGAAKCPLP